ncbi:MAG: glycosyltransferase family 4 protein [Brumimicrobium sp.]
MQRKRVLFLASWYPSRVNETLGNFVQRHAEVANKIAYITVLYVVSTDEVKQLEFDRKTINEVDTLVVYYPKSKSRFPVVSQWIKRRRYLNACKKGFSFLDEKFDLVHLNTVFPAGIFAKYLNNKLKVPYVLTVHWTGYLNHTNTYKKLPFFLKQIHYNIFKNASTVLPVSEHLGNSLIELGLIKKFTVLPNVVDESIFNLDCKSSKISHNRPHFLHVSSFNDEHKNISGMLQAFKNLQDRKTPYFLHLITEKKVEDVIHFVEEFKLDTNNLKIEGRQSPEGIAKAMKKADCFVLFSNYETFSVVLAESWMTGTPAIYSKCGGLTEIIDSHLGNQISKKDVNGLTKALESFSIENFDRIIIAKSAEKFSSKEVSGNILEIYNQLC